MDRPQAVSYSLVATGVCMCPSVSFFVDQLRREAVVETIPGPCFKT